MPMPKPMMNEPHQTFMDRCMSDDMMTGDYSDNKQRLAVCQSQWEKMHGASKSEDRAEWDTAFINNLPDSAFAYIEPGGTKDESGKTVPRSLRHFPHHGSGGALDLPHLRNALARAPQSPFGPKAMGHLRAHAKSAGVGENAHQPERELRYCDLAELRVEAEEDGPTKIHGYAAVFNEPSLPIAGQFTERIEPGAFGKALRGKKDIRALFNHSADYVLGRTTAKTLSVSEDERGLAVEITPPDTNWARDLVTSMQRGDINQMSFAFTVGKDSWSDDGKERTIREVSQLFDVSVVTYPAYPQTSAAARDLLPEPPEPPPEDSWRPLQTLLRLRLKLMGKRYPA